MVNLRAVVQGKAAHVDTPKVLEHGGPDPAAVRCCTWPDHGSRGGKSKPAVYDRASCAPATSSRGPAIVTEMDSTTLILPGHVTGVHRQSAT